MTKFEYKTAIVRQPGENFSEGLTQSKLGLPDFQRALEQHNDYVAALIASGLQVTCLPADPRFPDGCFVEDCAVVLPGVAIITNPGHPARKGETENISNIFARSGLAIERITDPGTVDGGDVLRIEDHYIIGLSKRTNKEGARQLGTILQLHGKTYAVVTARDLHLKTSVAYVGENCLVCTKDYDTDPEFTAATKQFIKRKIVVPDAERYAANCLRINATILLATGYDTTKRTLVEHDLHVVTLNMSEFQKMDGGLTCLSILLG
jgi:dimethylargininase